MRAGRGPGTRLVLRRLGSARALDDVVGRVSNDDGVQLVEAALLGVFDVAAGATRALLGGDGGVPHEVKRFPDLMGADA